MAERTKRGFFGTMKIVDTARASVEELADGRLRATIVHETMKGVTPAMLRWWFENIHTFTTWNGTDFDGPEVPVYRLWHPWDHIRVRWLSEVRGADGRLAPAAEATTNRQGKKFCARSFGGSRP